MVIEGDIYSDYTGEIKIQVPKKGTICWIYSEGYISMKSVRLSYLKVIFILITLVRKKRYYVLHLFRGLYRRNQKAVNQKYWKGCIYFDYTGEIMILVLYRKRM